VLTGIGPVFWFVDLVVRWMFIVWWVEGSKDGPSEPESGNSDKEHEDGTKGFKGFFVHSVVV
jgi:hypothetical protein